MRQYFNRNVREGAPSAVGLRSFLLIAAGCGLLASCQNQDPIPMTVPDATAYQAPSNQKIRYLALGDSYTIGEGEKREHTYPEQVARILGAEGWRFAPPKIVAKTGWTARDLLQAIDDQGLRAEKFDLVSLLIGVNNQYQGLPLRQFQRELDELIDLSLAMVNGFGHRLVLLSIPDWGVTPFGQNGLQNVDQIASEIDSYNAFIQEIAGRRNLHFIEITESYRGIGGLPANLVADDLHPSRYVYADWARTLSRVMKAELQQPPPKTNRPDEN